MSHSNYQLIGVITKTYGTEGEFILKSKVKFASGLLKKLESVFIDINEQLVPFFIASIKQRNVNSAIVRFDDIDIESRVRLLLGGKVYIPSEEDEDQEEEINDFSLLEGYAVIDIDHGQIGKIDQFLDIPNNPIFQILKGDNEILIPINTEIILTVDMEKQIIYIKAPEGLLDIYL